MTLCFFIAWWSLESSVCLPPWAIWRKMRKRYLYEVKGAAGGCGGASDGCWMRNLIPALLTLVFYQTSQRLELFFKEEENMHSWKINVLLDYFSSFLSPSHTHMHTHTSGSQMPNISFWSFYWWKKADISWKPIKLCDSNSTAFSITVFGLHIFLHSLFILVIFLFPLPLLEWEKISSLR